ncbi:MAG: helix-turn-helix transcriptional regulator [Actinomycetes bacterium]
MPGDDIELAKDSLERVLVVAAFFREHHGRSFTLDEVLDGIPEYAALENRESARRKFLRDRDELTDAKIVIDQIYDFDVDSGDLGDRYRYEMRAPFFRPDERAALIEAAAAVRIEGLDEDDPADLGGAVDSRSANVAVKVPAIIDELQRAIRKRRVVAYRYKDSERRVEPYRIGQWRGTWYLLARDLGDDRVKNWAIERIQPADDASVVREESGDHAFLPPDLDWDAQFALDPNEWGQDEPFDALVLIPRNLRLAFGDVFDGVSNREWVDDDSVVVTLTVRHLESTITRLLGFGERARVVGPPDFVAAFTAWLAPQTGDR